MNADVWRFQLDLWGKRVFVFSLLLLLALQAYVWLAQERGLAPLARGAADVPPSAAGDTQAQRGPSVRKPLALLAGPVLSVVDRSGRTVPLGDLQGPADLPVITGVDPEDVEHLDVALAALDGLRRSQFALYGRISELHFAPESGWIVYLTGSALPVILGPDSLKERLTVLGQALPILEKQEDLNRVEQLDLRFASQIVVRYRKSGSS